jgi:hypothetical protein
MDHQYADNVGMTTISEHTVDRNVTITTRAQDIYKTWHEEVAADVITLVLLVHTQRSNKEE